MDTLIDPSGDTLRTWMGIGEGIFYGDFGIAVMTMFFSGFDSKGAHLSIPQKCAFTLCQMILSQFPNIILTKFIVAYARKVDLKTTSSMQEVLPIGKSIYRTSCPCHIRAGAILLRCENIDG